MSNRLPVQLKWQKVFRRLPIHIRSAWYEIANTSDIMVENGILVEFYFREEYLELLKRFDIAYDEKYVFESVDEDAPET